MKKLKAGKNKNKVKKSKKSSLDFKSIQKSFTSLDPQNMGNWPIVVKLTVFLMIFIFVGALAFALPIKKKIEEIDAAVASQDVLLIEYSEKEIKARNLEKYVAQIEEMKNSFTQLLEQLPKDTKIPDLVEDINMKGIGSDIALDDISVSNEITRELFIEQPIVIQSNGEYHKFGNFVSSMASIPRIVTMHDFTIENKNKDDFNSVPTLDFLLTANTYRAKSNSVTDKDGGK